MKLIIHFAFLGICLAGVNTAILSEVKDNILKYLVSAVAQPKEDERGNQQNALDRDDIANDKNVEGLQRNHNEDDIDRIDEWSKKKYDFNIAMEPKQSRKEEKRKEKGRKGEKHNPTLKSHEKGNGIDQVIPLTQSPNKDIKIEKKLFHMDPILNSLRRHPENLEQVDYRSLPQYSIQPNYKRQDFRRADDSTDSSSSSSSSSRELKDFKEEFRELWLHKKYEALNLSNANRGDRVNMVAARPWGVPCGDPNQHDMPWGVCMLSEECESEFRIYRGDLFCGRTHFICCGLQLTTYDTYQGFDVSFDDKSLSTDSDEKRDRERSSKEKRRRKKARERRKRRRARNKRKKKIRKHIKKIIKEIRKILSRQYRNGTKQRKKRTKQLKKFVKDLKKQYKKDRQSVKDMHANDLMHIDEKLMNRLKEIQNVNKNFAKNATFRDIVLTGMITKKSARMLLEAYPELDEFLEARRMDGGGPRRAGGGDVSRESDEFLEYDVEYGYLYY